MAQVTDESQDGTVVISQSMYFPWVGLLEQVRLAKIFVHYDDVQLTRGFYNRVQVKTPNGMKWLTVPLRKGPRSQHIDEALLDSNVDWKTQHRAVLQQAYHKAPYREDMLALVDSVFDQDYLSLAQLTRQSILALAAYFGLQDRTTFLDSGTLGIGGSSSQRLCDIVKALQGTQYVTGHGALNYLDHGLFQQAGIDVNYMEYRCLPYPQLHGDFTPYVTALDLVANCGRDGARYIRSGARSWKEFVALTH